MLVSVIFFSSYLLLSGYEAFLQGILLKLKENYISEKFNLDTNERGNIKANSHATPKDKVFVAGDARRGQSLVVWAISEGRECAKEIDKYLMGYTNMV